MITKRDDILSAIKAYMSQYEPKAGNVCLTLICCAGGDY